MAERQLQETIKHSKDGEYGYAGIVIERANENVKNL